MARCLRCRAGNEWIEGDVPSASAEREQQLREALESVRRIALEVFREWDADNDPRVGKILGALAGKRGYRADIDAIHDALLDGS